MIIDQVMNQLPYSITSTHDTLWRRRRYFDYSVYGRGAWFLSPDDTRSDHRFRSWQQDDDHNHHHDHWTRLYTIPLRVYLLT